MNSSPTIISIGYWKLHFWYWMATNGWIMGIQGWFWTCTQPMSDFVTNIYIYIYISAKVGLVCPLSTIIVLSATWDAAGYSYSDVIMGTIASQITSLTIVYSTVYSNADQRKHQSCASLAFVRGIHRGPGNSPHKWQLRGKCFHLMTSSWVEWQCPFEADRQGRTNWEVKGKTWPLSNRIHGYVCI